MRLLHLIVALVVTFNSVLAQNQEIRSLENDLQDTLSTTHRPVPRWDSAFKKMPQSFHITIEAIYDSSLDSLISESFIFDGITFMLKEEKVAKKAKNAVYRGDMLSYVKKYEAYANETEKLGVPAIYSY